MSFITKRERVFNEYDLFDLPARNEGKLKAYASCTDARAWSHFCSDKSEHLVDIIKRNNETCRPKYLPTSVIVDTLMAAKNTEIVRLKQRISEFEQMLAAYDQLDLTCEQKCEIAEAHAAIKTANKELDELFLDLDVSGITEGLDSEAFETGKSKGEGDEIMTQTFDEELQPKKESKSIQIDNKICDPATCLNNTKIDELQESIISKDAKLNAMKNTIAVMENDVCEPYCIYAHIYTALEKIYGILCQNDKYKSYLNLMIVGRDTRCIDIRGKILYKLKILEKFSDALISPCNDDPSNNKLNNDCACYRAEVKPPCIETNFQITSSETTKPDVDNQRAHLVADIFHTEEIQEILSKDNISKNPDSDLDDPYFLHEYNIDTENLTRLKKLQVNYDDLMVCYESLKHEKICLETRCKEYENLEKEFDNLRIQINEYNTLWNEKEHYRKRSADLDSLKEQYLILTDEASNVETQLKAAAEINTMKSVALDDLRKENVALEKKMNEALIAFEKEKNNLLCKLKEADCTIMCQGQQIKTLTIQIDRLLEQEHQNYNAREIEHNSILLNDEVESYKDQIKKLKEALFCNEEEKHNLQQQYQDQLKLINNLRNDIEEYKNAYEKTLQRNDSLEKYTEDLIQEARCLEQDRNEKAKAVENLLDIVKTKSKNIKELVFEVENKKTLNDDLVKQIELLRSNYNESLTSLENEKTEALKSLQLAKQESQELVQKVKDYDYEKHLQADVSKSLETEIKEKKKLEHLLMDAVEENNSLKENLASREENSSKLVQEIENLREINSFAVNNMKTLRNENSKFKCSIELSQKESDELKAKLKKYENLSSQFKHLQDSHNKLEEENNRLKDELDNVIFAMRLTKKESDELIDKLNQSERAKDELTRLKESYQKLAMEKHNIHKELIEKNNSFEQLLQSYDDTVLQNEHLLQKCSQIDNLKQELEDFRGSYDELMEEKKRLQNELINEKIEFEKLSDSLEKQIHENDELREQIKTFEINEVSVKSSLKSLHESYVTTKAELNVANKESAELVEKIRQYENMELELIQLKRAHDEIIEEKDKLQRELQMQNARLQRIQKENKELQSQSQTLLIHTEDLESALISSRTQLIENSSDVTHSYKNILAEIEQMKREKLANHRKIRDLLDKLDESENVISNLSEDLEIRDDRIAKLENHINELEDEARKLHITLAEVIDTGEQIKDFSFSNLDSIKNMEAHHSKATHNMKMELAKLQQQNTNLEKQLSVTKLKSEESYRDISKHQNQIKNLKNEREMIVAEIKQLELKSVGDSNLVPSNCEIQNILSSLERVRKSFDARVSKSESLEQTIFKVQTSSQLLLSKADQAIKIVDKEKQKIINEKEDAIRDRQNMEKQMLDLKDKLEKEIANDKKVIQDLEGTILNQKLIINKITQSTQDYIDKLNNELQTLQKLYQGSKSQISELQEKLRNVTEDKRKQINMLEQLKKDFDVKSTEVLKLQKELEEIKSKPICNIGTQTKTSLKEVTTYVDNDTLSNREEISFEDVTTETEQKGTQLESEHTDIFDNDKSFRKHHSRLQKRSNDMPLNEVQILTANIEPSFNYVRNTYMNFKIARLSFGRLENISCFSSENDVDDNSLKETSQKTLDKESHSNLFNNPNLIDIYYRQSIHTNSSKDNLGSEKLFTTRVPINPTVFAEFDTGNTNNMNNNVEGGSTYSPFPDKEPDKDLFVLYKDGQNTFNAEPGKWSEAMVEQVAAYTNTVPISKQENNTNLSGNSPFYPDENEKEVKSNAINTKTPNVTKANDTKTLDQNDSNCLVIIPDGERKSSDSYSKVIYVTPKRLSASDTKLNDSENDTNIKKSANYIHISSNNENLNNRARYHPKDSQIAKVNVENDSSTSKQTYGTMQTETKLLPNSDKESHHKLSRVEANVLLLKKDNGFKTTEDNMESKLPSYALEYISDQLKGTQNYPKSNFSAKNTRIVKSDEMFHIVKDREHIDGSSPTFSCAKMTPIGGYTRPSTVSSQKTFTEQSVMVQLDDSDYQNTIKTLTKALETIEKDYKKKIEAIKTQYDSNIKCMINEHNQGVRSIQGLHEDTLQDIMKNHENEVENLRSMSIDAMRKAEKLEKENRMLKSKAQGQDQEAICLNEYPVKVSAPELRKRNPSTQMLTKTKIEAVSVKPRMRSQGPCTCSLDVNVSDTIRNIFEQVDVEQRKLTEHAYMKFIANKMMNGNVEVLDAQELSFLHLKVCRTWRTKLSKEEALQKKIESLESELMSKQRSAQQHFAELDRKVAEERRRLQEVCEAVCRSTPGISRATDPDETSDISLAPEAALIETDIDNLEVNTRGSAGDLIIIGSPNVRLRRSTTSRPDTVPAASVGEKRREKKLYNDEPPTRLRRSHDRQSRFKK